MNVAYPCVNPDFEGQNRTHPAHLTDVEWQRFRSEIVSLPGVEDPAYRELRSRVAPVRWSWDETSELITGRCVCAAL